MGPKVASGPPQTAPGGLKMDQKRKESGTRRQGLKKGCQNVVAHVLFFDARWKRTSFLGPLGQAKLL